MKRILFPTDFSDIATNAFVHALEFAKTIKAEIIVLHSYPVLPVDDNFFAENFSKEYDTVQLAEFDIFKEEVPKLHALAEACNLDKIKMTHRLVEGDLVANIADIVKAEKIDYVVMGTSGDTEWEAAFAGSIAGDVIIGIDVPVMCIPDHAKYNQIKVIGFTTRFREKDKIALMALAEFAKKIGAYVRCLYVKTNDSDISNDTIAAWKEEFKLQPVDFFIEESNEIADTVLDFIEQKNIDMLAMLTYKRGFFKGLFQPSYTKKPHPEFHIPLLAIHTEERKTEFVSKL